MTSNRWLKILLLMIMSIAFVLLDTSFFSFLTIYDSSIIISFLAVSIFSLRISEDFYLVSFFAIVFFTVFSSVPPWLIVICFLVLPSIVYYLRSNFLPEPSFPATIVYFILLNLSFDLVLLLNSGVIDERSLLSLSYFVVLNTLAGVLLFYVIGKIGKIFNRGEIKGL